MTDSPRQQVSGLLDRLYPLVAAPDDTEADRIRKSLVFFSAVAGALLSTVSALSSQVIGVDRPVFLSIYAYAAILAVGAAILVVSGRFEVPIAVALLAGNIAVAVFGTWYQGGVVPSGANVLWGLVAPVIAMLVFGRSTAAIWFGVFLASLGWALVFERADAPTLTDAQITGNFAAVLAGISVFLFLLFIYFTRERDRAQAEADFERARSDSLLHDVLPDEIVPRLKGGERVIADRFDEATVLFADIADFTPLSATMEPDELVQLLNEVFSRFDQLAARHGVEKIKTIGDCYMVAAGVPTPRSDHAAVLADMALDMRELVASQSIRGHSLSFRIGLSSGPLVAGVIGEQKFLYDLWGDTVNTASRMESHGSAGAIQITASTRDLLDDDYVVTPRGEVDVKGKGLMPVFTLEGRRNRTASG